MGEVDWQEGGAPHLVLDVRVSTVYERVSCRIYASKIQKTHCVGRGWDAEIWGKTSSAAASFRFLVETPVFGDSPVLLLPLDLGVLVCVLLALPVDAETFAVEELDEDGGGA